MFLKIPLNAFFDASDANFCLPRIRSRPRHFPCLKTQMTGFRQKSLPRTTSSQRAIPIERRAHFRDPPTRQTAEYYPIQRQTRFQSGKQTCFSLRKQKSAFSTEQKQTDLRRQKQPDFTLRKMPENGRLSVRRVLVATQFYGHSRINVRI